MRKKFHSYEIILPVDKKIIPWERFSINSDSRDKKNVAEKDVKEIINKAEDIEKSSNQILEFTKEIKKIDLKLKKIVLKTLWQIILSDNKSGIYENNLMRRICGLLYVPDKLSGEIKSNILDKKE